MNSNKRIRYINLNFILIYSIYIMIRLFLPFEYNILKNIYFKVILPCTFKIFSFDFKGIYSYDILLMIWITGFIVKSCRFIAQYYKICKDIKILPNCNYIKPILDEVLLQKKKISFKIVEISGLKTPVIFGLWHPIIMIPSNNYTKDELFYILRHETEHYYQHDLWIKVIMEFLCSLYWWNPFCNIFKGLVSKTLEMKIDSKVISSLDERQRLEYLSCLLKAAKNHTKIMNDLTLNFNGKRTNLKQRFFYILDYKENKKKRKRLIAVNSILALIIISLATAIILEPYCIKSEQILNLPDYIIF